MVYSKGRSRFVGIKFKLNFSWAGVETDITQLVSLPPYLELKMCVEERFFKKQRQL